MDFDSSSKFIASLAKFLQSLCNGYVDFDKGVEVIGHIYLNVDSDTGKKIDYVLNEKVCKNDNSVTFISNSFHAQPAEKPKPPAPKKDIEKPSESSSVILDESGQGVPNSTNVGTMGGYGGAKGDTGFSPGKRPGSPLNRRGSYRAANRPGMSPYKTGRSDIPPSPSRSMASGDDYDNFQGGDEENYDQSLDQKPVLDPDGSVIKQEHSQQGFSGNGNGYNSGPGRGSRVPLPQQPYLGAYPNPPSNYSNLPPTPQQTSDYSPAPSFEPGDPSTLTRAEQEELEMYYKKGTDQHLTFLRNMREAHAMYPFTGKRDKELFDKALAEVSSNLPAAQGEGVKVSMEDRCTQEVRAIPIRVLATLAHLEDLIKVEMRALVATQMTVS